MIRNKELKYSMLKKECNPAIFNFKTTKEVGEMDGVIGQDKGIESLEFGLNVKTDGYNIYVEGPSGIGKTSYTINYVSKKAKKLDTPDDWCYIYNFSFPNEPISIPLPSGQGKVFQNDMINFVQAIRNEITQTFNNDDYEKEKNLISQEFENKKNILLNGLNKEALELGFEVKNSANGLYFLPIHEGKTLSEEEFSQLSKSIQNEFEAKSKILEQRTLDIINDIKEIDLSSHKRIMAWESNIALLTINLHINDLKTKYKKHKKIQKYFDNIRTDILSNIDLFIEKPASIKEQNSQPKVEPYKPWEKYEVNLFVDNSETEGAPVIDDPNPTYFNLFGKVEYDNIYGNLRTDYRMIKAGSLHKANGGYLIVQAKDLLSSVQIWETFKRMIRTKQIFIDPSKDSNTNVAIIGLKPDAIPLNIKVILLGTSEVYHQILALDEDFRKIFRIKVEFDEEAPKNEQNINKTVQFISQFCSRENLPHFNPSAVAKIIEYSSRLVENQNKLSTQLNEILQIICEAATWAKIDKKKIVTVDYVKKAITQRLERVSKYDFKSQEMILDNTILVDTSGYKVGEINGLSILTVGDFMFGKPSKITANTFMGKDGIINIEREVMMSGVTHSKGVLIISGYIGEKFAQDIPLSLNASICFEQLYGGIDGDSASSTELYAILSSLSEIPINQAIAVTGSINQKGEIQPIGGVTEKIEGYFNICKSKGLTGDQGVMIPYQNIKNLNLNDEVIDAVKEEQFHIYAIKTIEEGIEVLTGVPAGRKNKDGHYTLGSVNYLVYEKLKKYAENSKNFKESN